MILLVVTLTSLVAGTVKCEMNEVRFVQDPDKPLCDVLQRLSLNCSRYLSSSTESRSLVQCSLNCGIDTRCTGLSLDEFGQCYLHQPCPGITTCTTVNTNHNFWTRYCVEGTWDRLGKACKCHDGFHRDRCDRRFSTCNDLLISGYPSGYHRVLIDPNQDGSDFFEATCFVKFNNYANFYVLRNGGQFDFNRTWSDYVNGFYYDELNYWLGLQPWHELSEIGCNDVRLKFTVKNCYILQRTYWDFELFDRDNKYAFSFRRSRNDSGSNLDPSIYLGECLYPLQNNPFSTWDKDNGAAIGGDACASGVGSGWWFLDGCDVTCNIFGYGLQFWNDKPRDQLMSLVGVDMERLASEMISISIVLFCE